MVLFYVFFSSWGLEQNYQVLTPTLISILNQTFDPVDVWAEALAAGWSLPNSSIATLSSHCGLMDPSRLSGNSSVMMY